jgi:hypothetical protein
VGRLYEKLWNGKADGWMRKDVEGNILAMFQVMLEFSLRG